MLIVAILGAYLLNNPYKLEAELVPEVPKEPKVSVQALVSKYSAQYRVSSVKMMQTIKCEDTSLEFDKQSDLTYKPRNRWKLPAGSREKSYGLVQIHLPDHPEISYEQAIDPNFAVEFMAQQFAEGNGKIWSCY